MREREARKRKKERRNTGRIEKNRDVKVLIMVYISGSVCFLIGLQPAGGKWM